MEVNKEQAEKCRSVGADALKRGDYPRAVKFLTKSLQLYPLPGVEALLGHAKGKLNESSSSSSTTNGSSQRQPASNGYTSRAASTSSVAAEQSGADGRAYTDDQVKVVKQVLSAKEGGRGAHYRVLGLRQDADESQIKKAYRKLSLKVHPDKNSAPHADEAFKAVGLAYATLSDTQKRAIYDRYGEEDPDNRGGGGRGGVHMNGQEVNPEDIFNMFFGGGGMGGMHGGGPGFHVYSSGFGPGGMHFRTGRPQRQRRGGGGRQQQQQQEQTPSLGFLFQMLPLLILIVVSFMRVNDGDMVGSTMPGENKYFSLTFKKPFVHQLSTRLTEVKDIPYYVSERFLQTYHRNRYQLGQVESMVERAYEQYLVTECKNQVQYKRRLEASAAAEKNPDEQAKKQERVTTFELSRCKELDDLFPRRKQKMSRFS